MKQKIKLLLYSVLSSILLLPAPLVQAQTACTYSLRFWETNNTTAAQAGTQLNFRAEVTRSGNLANCSNSVNITGLYVIDTSGTNPIPKVGNLNSVNFSGNIATQNYAYRVPTNIPSTAQLKFWAFTNLSGVPQSPNITINLTGSTGGGNGSVRVNVSFNPAKASYKSGDPVQIFAQANTSDINSLPTGIQQIFIQFRVNGQDVGSLTKNRSDVVQSTQYLETTVTAGHGFQFGSNANTPNSITVSLWQTGGTGLKFGEGTATLQTGNANSLTEVIANPTTVKPDSDIIISLTNPSGQNFRGTINVNGTSISFGALPYTLKSSTANGFVNGRNTVTVTALDNNGQPIVLANSGQLTITVDPNATPPTTASQKWGCKMPDGKYTCGTQEMDAVLVSCPTPPTLINSCYCDKTDDEIKTKCSATGTTNPTLPTDKLINPIPTEGLLDTFLGITKGFLAGLAIWAVIAIIFAGFRMVISAGNEEAITQAKKAITWAILGLVVALLSFSMVAIVQNILNVDTTKFDPGLPAKSGYNIPPNKNI